MHIALCGTGTMGRAIIEGLRGSDPAATIVAHDVSPQALAGLPPGVAVSPPAGWFTGTPPPDAVVLAVKPPDVPGACAEISAYQKEAGIEPPLWISVAAGISLEKLESLCMPGSRIGRVMPNTPARIGEALSAYACNRRCTETDARLIERIFSACGKTVRVPEKLLHAITGLSGSGPAYVFLFIEALIEGGVTAGLPLTVARECAIQTVLGAAKMAGQSGEHTGALKAGVMSPGGTTAAGLRALERHAFKHAVIEAVCSAAARSEELGK